MSAAKGPSARETLRSSPYQLRPTVRPSTGANRQGAAYQGGVTSRYRLT